MFEQLTFQFQKYKSKNQCQFPDCDRLIHAKGLCKAHHKQRWKGKPLTPLYSTVPKPSPRHFHPKEHNSWRCMKNRCYKPTDVSYKYCGARGLTVCARWLQSFWNFLEDMGKAPSPIHTLDRINNDLGYFPANVRWATPSEQAHNTVKCRWITFEGESMLVGDLAKKEKICESSLREHIFRSGFTPEEAVKAMKQRQSRSRMKRRKRRKTAVRRRSFP